MTKFQNILWGYEIEYPDFWTHQQTQELDVFVASTNALKLHYQGPDSGQIMVRGEWNWACQDIEPLWNQHVGKLAVMLGAKNVGSAPWRIGEATGLEAEIVLPKRDSRRLWTGILMRKFVVLHFMVMHPKQIREKFEPEATKIISSLRFPDQIAGSIATEEGLPLPPGFSKTDPQVILKDINDPLFWHAYIGDAGVGALQAFYLRELLLNKWDINEYVPYPSPSELGFARYILHKGDQLLTLGLMPSENASTNNGLNQTGIVYKVSGT